MKVVRIKRHPMGHNFYAINLFSVVFSIGPLSPVESNHEYIHTLQQRELLFIPFYLIYLADNTVRHYRLPDSEEIPMAAEPAPEK